MNQSEENTILFKPAWWLSNPHLQTLWSTLFRKGAKNLKLKRERIELKDGDFIDLDWTEQKNCPLVLILHGFEGSVKSPYAQGMLSAIHQRGWCGVFMHFRGCSGEVNRHARTYHSGDTDDLAFIIEIIQSRANNQPIAAIGFSLGGNVLLKWLGETGAHSNPLCAAVAVSVPFDLHKTAERIQQGFSRVYQEHFMRSVCKKIREKNLKKPMPIDVSVLDNLHSLREFDDKITAPLHGFKNADDYYQQASSRQFLKKIAVPTLLLQAKDDPFMMSDTIPEASELSPLVRLELSDEGGHVGFISGSVPWRAEYWLEKRVPEFLTQYLEPI